jgi:hypothetical protein
MKFLILEVELFFKLLFAQMCHNASLSKHFILSALLYGCRTYKPILLVSAI